MSIHPEPLGIVAPLRLELSALYQVRDVAIATVVYGSAPLPGGVAPDIIGGSMPGPGGLASIITAGDGATVRFPGLPAT